jgi:hypothetical protein
MSARTDKLYDPPWEARYDADRTEWYVASGCIIVADQISNHDEAAPDKGFEIRKAKALLMAASPELLDALKLMRDAWDMPDNTAKQRAQRGKAWRAMRAAMAKAEGKPEPAELPTAAEARNV